MVTPRRLQRPDMKVDTDAKTALAEFIATHLQPSVDIVLQGDRFGEELDTGDVLDTYDNLAALADRVDLPIETGVSMPSINTDGYEQRITMDRATPDQLRTALMVAAAELTALQREAISVMNRGIALTRLIDAAQIAQKES